MKRFVVGLALLLVLPVLGGITAGSLLSFQESLTAQLAAADTAAQAEDWQQAEARISQCRSRWQQRKDALAALSSHSPMEEVDCLFAQLDFYLQCRDARSFCLCCRILDSRLRALEEAQRFNLQNLL